MEAVEFVENIYFEISGIIKNWKKKCEKGYGVSGLMSKTTSFSIPLTVLNMTNSPTGKLSNKSGIFGQH